MPHHEQPSVSFRLLVRAGAVQEPADKPGVASFVAALLNQGTTTRVGRARSPTPIESAGGVIGVGSGNELTFVSGAVIKDQTDLVLALASDIVQRPAFAPAGDRRCSGSRRCRRCRWATTIPTTSPTSSSIAWCSASIRTAGRTRARRSRLPRITRDDLVAFHRTWFVPEQRAARDRRRPDRRRGVCRRREGVRQLGAARRAGDQGRPTRRRRRAASSSSIGPGSAQTEIRVGHLAIARTHPDFVPLDLAIRILGGEGANRLFGVLRSDRGLTYGASADFHTFKNGGESSPRPTRGRRPPASRCG